jgi:subtilisin family serine protease
MEEPIAPMEEPAAPAEEPAAPAEEPAAPAEEPAAPAEEPAAPAEEPAAPAEEPAAPAEEPAAPAEEPAAPAEEPAAPMEEPAAPAEQPTDEALPVDAPVSAYAPAEPLLGQVDYYMSRLEEAVSTPDEYKDGVTRIERDSNTMIVIALALGLHDEDHKLKANAPAMLHAAQALAATEDYEAAKAAVEKLKAAVAEGGEGPELKWEKVASLKELMEQVPLIHASIRRRVSRRFEQNADAIAGDAVTVAVIAQGTIPNIDETIEPDKPVEWKKCSLQMRDAAVELLAAAQAKNEEAAQAAFTKLDQSCHDCHVIFHPEEVNK